MGFINNTSTILNAVLTKKGRQYLAKSDGKFNITKFAISDDEIDYTLWDRAHPLGNDYYGAVLESTPMLEPCVDPEVVMKYKLFTMPVGTKALPYIANVTPPSLLGDNALVTGYNETETTNPWSVEDHVLNPTTQGANGAFSAEDYSFLVLNKNVIDIGVGQGDNLNFVAGTGMSLSTGKSGTTHTVTSTQSTVNDPIMTVGEVTSSRTVMAAIASGVSTAILDDVGGIVPE